MITQFGVPDSTDGSGGSDDTTPPDTDGGSDNSDSDNVI
jgi:flagellar basal-body rod modification protein FlgD